jgi:hypothetical protein
LKKRDCFLGGIFMVKDYSDSIHCAYCGEKIPRPMKNCHVFCPECGEEISTVKDPDDILYDYENGGDQSDDGDIDEDDDYGSRYYREQDDGD